MENQSFFESELHPLRQAVAFVVFNAVVVIAVVLVQLGNEELLESTLCLELSLSILLTFAIFNSVIV